MTTCPEVIVSAVFFMTPLIHRLHSPTSERKKTPPQSSTARPVGPGPWSFSTAVKSRSASRSEANENLKRRHPRGRRGSRWVKQRFRRSSDGDGPGDETRKGPISGRGCSGVQGLKKVIFRCWCNGAHRCSHVCNLDPQYGEVHGHPLTVCGRLFWLLIIMDTHPWCWNMNTCFTDCGPVDLYSVSFRPHIRPPHRTARHPHWEASGGSASPKRIWFSDSPEGNMLRTS